MAPPPAPTSLLPPRVPRRHHHRSQRCHRRRPFALPSGDYPRRPNKHRTRIRLQPISRTSLVALAFLLACGWTPAQIHAQGVYKPRFGASSAIANNALYVAAGSSVITADGTPNADLLMVPLDFSFSTLSAPWQLKQSGYMVLDARMVSTLDESRLVMVGMGEQNKEVLGIYDIAINSWYNLPTWSTEKVAPQSSRTMSSIALDQATGSMIVYGGLGTKTAMSNEIDIIDARKSNVHTWKWSGVIVNPPLPALVQPLLIHLPRAGATLLMGGCDTLDYTRRVSNCVPLDKGYLIKAALSATDTLAEPIQQRSLGGTVPVGRSAPCVVALPDGNVFLYGGATYGGTLNDAWILSTNDWTWTARKIDGLPPLGRSGATCQLAGDSQIVLVGGHTGGLTGPKDFAMPQMAVINIASWSWTYNFAAVARRTPPGPFGDSPGLGQGPLIGIISAGCVLLGLLVFGMSRLIRKRKKHQAGKKILRRTDGSNSSDPLILGDHPRDSSIRLSNNGSASRTISNNGDSVLTTPSEAGTMLAWERYGLPSSVKASKVTVTTLTPPMNKKDRKPFIIMPFPATGDSEYSSNSSDVDVSKSHGNNSTNNMSNSSNHHSNSHNRDLKQSVTYETTYHPIEHISSPFRSVNYGHSSPVKKPHQQAKNRPPRIPKADFPESDRLPRDAADTQMVYYNRMNFHNKRLQGDSLMGDSTFSGSSPSQSLSRVPTLYDHVPMDDGGEEQEMYMVSTLVKLPEIGLGEDSFPSGRAGRHRLRLSEDLRGGMEGEEEEEEEEEEDDDDNDGMLVSTHLESSVLESRLREQLEQAEGRSHSSSTSSFNREK